MSIYDVTPKDLIEKVAEELKNIDVIKAPEWARFAKTGAHKERAPLAADWWYTRTAAVLRSVAVLGPIGVSKLRTKYGGKKRRGHKKAQFRRGSGSVIRKVLQQLEKAELIKFTEKGVHKGRIVAPKGKSLLDKASVAIKKANPRKVVKKGEPKKEIKKEKPAAEAIIEEAKKAGTQTTKESDTTQTPKVKEEAKKTAPAEKTEVKEETKPVEEKPAEVKEAPEEKKE